MRHRFVPATVALLVSAGLVWPVAPSAYADDSTSQAPAVVDAASAPDEATARAIAAAYQHPVTVDSETTETVQVQIQADGSAVMTQDTQPVRVRQGDGWVPTDMSLGASDGALQPQATAVPVQFSGGGAGALAKVQAPSGEWLSESWQDGTLPTPSVDGDTATYPEVYPGVDLKLTATATGMAQVFVIKSAQAAQDPQLADIHLGVDNGSLTTTPTNGGTAVVKDTAGTVQLTAPAATWWDSSTAGSSAEGPGGDSVPVPVPGSVTDTQVTINAAAPAQTVGVTYPVYVDPDWSGADHDLSWAMIDAAYSTTPYWEGTAADAQHVGYIDAGNSPDDHKAHTARSYWQMDVGGLAHKHITFATFHVNEVHSYSCTATPVELWTTAVATTSTTWSNPATFGTKVDTENAGHGYNSSCPAADVPFTATDAVQRAADAAAAGINLGLKATSETDITQWKKFAPHGQLIVGYASYPSVPAFRGVRPCFASCDQATGLTRSKDPTLFAESDIADSGVNLDYEFRTCFGTPSSQGSCLPNFILSNQVPGARVSEQVPGETVWGGTNVYQVRACRHDGTGLCSDFSSWYPYTVDTVAPPAPTATSSAVNLYLVGTNAAPAKGGEGAIVSITIQPPTGVSDIQDFVVATSQITSPTVLSSPACGGHQGSLAVVCPTALSQNLTTSVLSPSNRLTLWSVDKAGNVSATTTVYEYDVIAPPPGVTLAAGRGHEWLTQSSDATADTPPASSYNLNDGNGNTQKQLPLTVTGGRSWLLNGVTADPATTFPTDVAMPSSHDAAVIFDGTDTQAITSAGSSANPTVVMDSTNGLAVAAWVRAAPADATPTERVIMSQATDNASFVLEETADGQWAFCMSDTLTGTTPNRPCSQTPIAGHDDGRWTLVEGVWDPQHGFQVRARGYDSFGVPEDGYQPDGPWVPHTPTSPDATSSAAPIVVGGVEVGGTLTNRWKGALADPLILVTTYTAGTGYDNGNLSDDTTTSLRANVPLPTS